MSETTDEEFKETRKVQPHLQSAAEVSDDDFRNAMRQQVLTVGKILDRFEVALANSQPLRLKAKEVKQLVTWIQATQAINATMEAQLQTLGEAYMAQLEEIEKLRKIGGSKVWRPGR